MKVSNSDIATQCYESFFHRYRVRNKLLYQSVLLFVIAVMVSLPFINVDINILARGIIGTEANNYTIKSAFTGLVVKNSIALNKKTEPGDTLLLFDCREIDQLIVQSKKSIEDLNLHISDLQNAISDANNKFELPNLEAEYRSYENEILKKQHNLRVKKSSFKRTELLYKSKSVAPVEYENSLSELEFAQLDLSGYIKQKREQWQNQKYNLEIKCREEESILAQNLHRRSKTTITSPLSGFFVNVQNKSKGSMVFEGEIIAEISPNDSALAKVYVQAKDIAYVKVGLLVNLNLDAFNHNIWGNIKAKVSEVGKEIISIENQNFYMVKCKIIPGQKKDHITGNLLKGMAFTASVRVAQRSAFQLIYDKFDSWINPNLK